MSESSEDTDHPTYLRQSESASDHVRNARARVRSEAETIGISDQYISDFVEQFYVRIQADELLGPMFAARITDWPPHLERMKMFWRSVLHSSGEYSGNPMQLHLAMPDLEERHFAHWLTMFYETLHQLGSPEAAQLVGMRARMIAAAVVTGIEIRAKGIGGIKAGENLPYV